MDVVALRRQGSTIGQIADAIGHHPATVSSWLRRGGPPPKGLAPAADRAVVDDRWAGRIAELPVANPELLATSVERIIAAEGWVGSYESLVRHLRAVRGVRRPRSPAVSVPIETPAGAEFQFDWSDCCDWGEAWGLRSLQCFGAVMCWSRRRHWFFAPSLGRAHTFEGWCASSRTWAGSPPWAAPTAWAASARREAGVFRFCAEASAFARYHELRPEGVRGGRCQTQGGRRSGHSGS